MTEERWHNFAKEKPSEDMEGRNFIVSNGHYEKIATWYGYWENEPFMGDHLCDEVVRWKFYFTPEEEKANEATRTEPKPMKCDELKQVENPIEWGLYYDKSEVDAAIAELKDKIKIYEDLGSCKKGCPALRHNQRRVESEIYKVELKDKEIKELKQKLEDAKASHYAEMVDAGMRERRLRRLLWHARADRAKEKAFNWRFRNPNNNNCLYGINYLVEYDERKIRRTNNEWFEVFSEVERKCRAKAEQYK